MTKNTFVVGFMLFAIFFGAGNLIFPPKLGLDSGEYLTNAYFGFTLTGVGLPLLGIIISAYYTGGYKEALNKIHPWFSVIFLSAIYLSIGPFLAIPRTAATSYEIAVFPLLNEPGDISLLIFTALYFALSLWLALNPSKMVERVGAILTPVLLIAIAVLVAKSFFILDGNTINNTSVTESVFFTGFVSGYLTMDALASIAFSVLVIAAIQAKMDHNDSLPRQTLFASIIAGVALILIYFSLAWIGNNISLSVEELSMIEAKKLNVGTYILNRIAFDTFGEFGQLVLGLIVTLACLTTAIGLIVSVSEYFNEVYHKISYKIYVIFFTLLSLLISNQGLNAVLSKSVPVLLVLYPIAITVILLMAINLKISLPFTVQRITIAFVSIISLLSVAEMDFTKSLPLKAYSMEWLPFALAGLVLGYICHFILRKSK